MNLKQILKTAGIIIGFIAVVLFLGYMIYSIFFRQKTPNNGLTNINGIMVNTGNLPSSNGNINRSAVVNVNGQPLPVSDVARGGNTYANELVGTGVDGVTVIGGNLRYYDPATGQFYQISADGKTKTLLTDEIFAEAQRIAWAPNASQAIMTFPDGTNIMYDFNTKKQATLPKEMKEIEFSPTGEEIGYEYVTGNPDDNFLGISKPNGSEIQRIEPLGDQGADVEVNWSPNKQVLATYRKSDSGDSQEVYFVGLHGENYKLLNVDGRGFEGQWSQSGSQLVYSTYSAENNYNPTLWLSDAGGDSTGMHKINTGLTTWASKCVMGNGSAFCGVPLSLGTGSGLYPEIAKNVPDNFYRIDYKSGAKTKIAYPLSQNGQGFNASNLYLSPDESILYFTDANTGKLNSIKLK